MGSEAPSEGRLGELSAAPSEGRRGESHVAPSEVNYVLAESCDESWEEGVE